MQEKGIIHETNTHWVSREAFKGREIRVWRVGITHNTLVSTYDLGKRGRQRAIDRCQELTQGETTCTD